MTRIVSRLCLALVLVYTAAVGLRLIAARGPYPLYGDERHVAGTAWRMVDEGTLKPGFYRYGSFPMYLTAATMALTAQGARAAGLIESNKGSPPRNRPVATLLRGSTNLTRSSLRCASSFHTSQRRSTSRKPRSKSNKDKSSNSANASISLS